MNDRDLQAAIRDVLARQAILLSPPELDVDRFVAELGRDPGTDGADEDAVGWPGSDPTWLGPVQDNGDRPQGGRRSAIVAIAAAILVAVGLLGAIVGLRPDPDALSTDLPDPTTTDPVASTTTSTEPVEGPEDPPGVGGGDGGGFEAGAREAWPAPTAGWVLVAYEEHTQPGGGDTGDVYVFDRNGSIVLLTVDEGREGPALDTANPESLANRRTVEEVVDGQYLRLTAFDITEGEVTSVAAALERDGDRWTLPGATVVLDQPSSTLPAGHSAQLTFAPLDADGVPDLTATVMQLVGDRSVGSMYVELGEASSLGETKAVEIAEDPGFLITGSEPEYALHYADGFVSSWQTQGADVDLGAFVANLGTWTAAEWEDSIEAATTVRDEALDAAADRAGPIPVVATPRFLLPEPWTLTRVFDTSQWSEEDRARWVAQVEATNGVPLSEQVRFQTFRVDGAAPSTVPDVVIEIDVVGGPYTPDTTAESVSISGLPGALYSNEHGFPEIVVGRDNVVAYLRSSTLSAEGLTAFAEQLALRSEDPTDGFVTDVDGYVVGFDGRPPLEERPIGSGSWSTRWGTPTGRSIGVSLETVPAEQIDLTLAFWAFHRGGVDVVDTERGIIEMTGRGENEGAEQVLVDRTEDLGAYLAITGDIDEARAAADALVQVSEEEWVTAVGPYVAPLDLDGN